MMHAMHYSENSSLSENRGPLWPFINIQNSDDG